MFCPKCGAEQPDEAVFCGSCGQPIRGKSPAAQTERAKHPAPAATSGPSQNRTAIIVIIVAVIVIAIAAAMFLSRSCSGSQPSNVTTGQSGNAATAASTATVTDPKSQMVISDVVFGTDATGRYYTEAVITNESDKAYDVTLSATAIDHTPDKYGEDPAERAKMVSSTATPWVDTKNGEIYVYNLKAGESRAFTIYPVQVGSSYLLNPDNSTDSPEFTVKSVTLTNIESKTKKVPDEKGGISVENLTVTSSKLSGTVVNNTGKYLTSASLRFVAYDENGLPLNSNRMHGSGLDRFIGAQVLQISAWNLKPGGSSEFHLTLYNHDDIEGASTVELRDAYYDIDTSK